MSTDRLAETMKIISQAVHDMQKAGCLRMQLPDGEKVWVHVSDLPLVAKAEGKQ